MLSETNPPSFAVCRVNLVVPDLNIKVPLSDPVLSFSSGLRLSPISASSPDLNLSAYPHPRRLHIQLVQSRRELQALLLLHLDHYAEPSGLIEFVFGVLLTRGLLPAKRGTVL